MAITARFCFMEITAVRAIVLELGRLMLWMLPACATTLARPLKVSRAALAMRDFNMKQQSSHTIPFNRLTFSSWRPSRQAVPRCCCANDFYNVLAIKGANR